MDSLLLAAYRERVAVHMDNGLSMHEAHCLARAEMEAMWEGGDA